MKVVFVVFFDVFEIVLFMVVLKICVLFLGVYGLKFVVVSVCFENSIDLFNRFVNIINFFNIIVFFFVIGRWYLLLLCWYYFVVLVV